MPKNEQFKYFAFISYNAKDIEWGKKVQRKLENFRMPATLCSEHGWKRTPINPVFFAPTDIQPGGLTEELQERLRSSRNLIVICSPNSAKSIWVGKEIEFFHGLGRTKYIHFFIVDGVPHSGDPETECFNPIVDTLELPEILGANINEIIYKPSWLNKERAYVQLVSKLLGVEFDAIWQRHRRRLIQKIILSVAATVAILATFLGIWVTNQPVDVRVSLRESSFVNNHLPPVRDAIITLSIKNEDKTDTLRSFQSHALFTNIPHLFLNTPVHISVVCRDFINIDTTAILSKDMILNIYRDPTIYGNIRFRLYHPEKEMGVPDTKLFVNGFETFSDKNGYVSLFIPLEYQDSVYHLITPYALVDDTVYMPCGENDVIMIK